MPFPILLPKNGDGFLLRSFTREDAVCLAEIEFNPEVKQFLALPKKGRPQWIEDFDPESYGGWAIDVDGVLAGRGSILRGDRRGDGDWQSSSGARSGVCNWVERSLQCSFRLRRQFFVLGWWRLAHCFGLRMNGDSYV